jgi:PTS system nitrogen regulatory IIA component
MGLDTLVRPEHVFSNLEGTDRPTVLRAISELVEECGLVRSADELYERLWEREELGSTGVGGGIAIPHCKYKGIPEVIVAVGICGEAVEFDSIDGEPVGVLFLVISPENAPADHLRVLAAISKWVKGGSRSDQIRSLNEPAAICALLQEDSP